MRSRSLSGRTRRCAVVLLTAAATALAGAPGAAAAPVVDRATRAVAGPDAATAPTVVLASVEGERLALAAGKGQATPRASASGGAELLIWTDATASGPLRTTSPATALRVVLRGDQCQGAPTATVDVDGRRVATTAVPSTAPTTLTVPGAWAAGDHRVAVGFTGDLQAGCDRNLRVDRVDLVGPSPAPVPVPGTGSTGPLAGVRFWVDPASNARAEADRSSGATAAAFRRIADQPSTVWLGDWDRTQDVARRVADVVRSAAATSTVPVFALYAVPHRDCGSYSRGGLPDAAAYAAWVRQVRAGLGGARAVLVLEPDALAQLDCLPSDADRRERTAVLRDAVDVLTAAPGALTYLDAGTSRWVPADAMAQRLRDAGVARARGFALNVANHGTTAAEAGYGDQVSNRLGGKPFVIDTSRNGNGPGDTWCNPQGRALGTPPTGSTGRAGVDALLWVKRVGESDGDCGRGEPAAGTWWPAYALGLAQRASW